MNVLCLVILVMSGLQIFNAHPALYWGEDSDFERPLLSIYTAFTAEGRPIGVTRVLRRTFDTTGVLGRSQFNGRPAQRAFPARLTIPSTQDPCRRRYGHPIRRPVVHTTPEYAPPSLARSFMSPICTPVCSFSLWP